MLPGAAPVGRTWRENNARPCRAGRNRRGNRRNHESTRPRRDAVIEAGSANWHGAMPSPGTAILPHQPRLAFPCACAKRAEGPRDNLARAGRASGRCSGRAAPGQRRSAGGDAHRDQDGKGGNEPNPGFLEESLGFLLGCIAHDLVSLVLGEPSLRRARLWHQRHSRPAPLAPVKRSQYILQN